MFQTRYSEIVLLLAFFTILFFMPLALSDLPVFAGEFNDVDGSLYAVRCFDAIIATMIVLLASRKILPQKSEFTYAIQSLVWVLVILLAASGLEWLWDRLTLVLFNLPLGAGEISDKMLAYPNRKNLDLTIVSGNGIILAGALVYALILDRSKRLKLQENLKRETLEAELKYLRSQTDPHFLFNTLNNIYAITQRNKDTEGSDAILRLSGLLRYMLYDSTGDRIALVQEIEHLRYYMDLMLLKYRPDARPDISLEIDEISPAVEIAPLLLLPFIENAFKHGVDKQGRGSIKLNLSVAGGREIQFYLQNTYPEKTPLQKQPPGIGLANVKKRLNLYYPGCHHLEVQDADNTFAVELRIQL